MIKVLKRLLTGGEPKYDYFKMVRMSYDAAREVYRYRIVFDDGAEEIVMYHETVFEEGAIKYYRVKSVGKYEDDKALIKVVPLYGVRKIECEGVVDKEEFEYCLYPEVGIGREEFERLDGLSDDELPEGVCSVRKTRCFR